MGINVVWKDERGHSLGEIEDAGMLLSRFAARHACRMTSSICLQFLDPAGDACFNQGQIPHLVNELVAAKESIDDPKLVAHLDQIIVLAERAREVHTYLWFVGD